MKPCVEEAGRRAHMHSARAAVSNMVSLGFALHSFISMYINGEVSEAKRNRVSVWFGDACDVEVARDN